MNFSHEQQLVIEAVGKGMAVLAGAGCGKTTTLVAKCERLIKKNPDAQCIAISFTERSAADLKSRLCGPRVSTIHGLCASLIRENSYESGVDSEFFLLGESDAQFFWRKALDWLWTASLPSDVEKSFDFLLERETHSSLHELLGRVKNLFSFGILPQLFQSEDLATRALACLSKLALDHYQKLKTRQSVLDFDDLERYALKALESVRVCEGYHRRFDLIVVDEFQDTNPIQAQLISKLVRPGFSNLCVVGDPKQSIYRFRDADVGIFEEFCSRLPIQISLTWNFRSRPEIVDFINKKCEKIFLESNLKFESLIATRESNFLEETGLKKNKNIIYLNADDPKNLAIWLKNEIKSGARLEDFALLLRKVRGNEDWLKSLTDHGIPLALGSGGLFWEDPRVRELVSLLRWLDQPENSLFGAIFLRSPWMEISDVLLDEWIQEDPTWVKPFFESQHPVAVGLDSIRLLCNQGGARPGDVYRKLWVIFSDDPEKEAELAVPLLGLWHRAEALSAKGFDFHEIVLEFSRSMDSIQREKKIPPPSSLQQLTVLTVHGAKGLEFPNVILIDFSERPKSFEMPLLFWDRINGCYLSRRNEHGDLDLSLKEEQLWREQEKQKIIAESKRLFYVALTRAQERLVLVCPSFENSDSLSPEKDHWLAWLDCVPEIPQQSTHSTPFLIEPVLAEIPPTSTIKKTVKSFVQWSRSRHSVTEWVLLSRCPRAYEWTFIRTKAAAAQQEERVENQIGKQVHFCLQNEDWDGLQKLEQEVGSDHFNSKRLIDWVHGMGYELMRTPDPVLGREVWSELSFEVEVGGAVLVGSMDRVVYDPSFQLPYCIIDYKVSKKTKHALSHFVLSAYSIQMELYAFALKKLVPHLTLESIQSKIISISTDSVQAMSVPLKGVDPLEFIQSAQSIARGNQGSPQVSSWCRFCPFLELCPEGRLSFK